MRKLKLFSLLCLLLIGVGQMWGAKDDVVYTLNTASTTIATANSYASYEGTDWKVTCGSKQSAGLWLGANSNQSSKMKLNNGSFDEGTAIATAIGVQATATYYAAIIGTSALENVYKVRLTYTTPGGTAPSEAWICYSTDDGKTWSVGKKVTSLSTSGTDFEFDATIASARYAFVIHSTAYCQFKVPVLTFYEGTTGSPDVCADPVFDPNGGSVESGTEVTITTETEGATIYYTMGTDPADPTSSSNEYTDPIEITANTTIKAIAIKEGNTNSDVVEKSFTVAAALTDEEFGWSATEYEATLNGENTFPELTNTHNLGVTYESTTPATATVNASGEVTPVKVGTTTIKAIWTGNSTYAAKTVSYDLTVVKGADSNTSKTLDLTKDETTDASDSKLEWTGTYVTTTVVKGQNGTNANNYYPGTSGKSYTSTRFYNGSTLTFTPVSGYKITTIVFTATSNNYASVLKNSTWTNATASMEEGNTVTEVTVTASSAGNVSAAITGTCGFTQIVINYAVDQKYAVAVAAPTGGTLTIKDGDDAISTGAEFSEGKVLDVVIAADAVNHYIGGAVAVRKTSDNSDVTSTVYNAGTGKLTVPAYGITVSASFTPTYAIELAADGGSIALEYTAGGAPEGRATEGTEIISTATADDNHTFSALALSDNAINPTIDGNVAMFTMPAGNVTVTATFEEKGDPYITLSQTADMDFGTPAVGSAAISKKFTVTGGNLTNGLTVAITSEDNSKAKFSVNVAEISAASVMAEGGVEVTVTANPNEAGDYLATITVDDGENGATAQSFDVILSVQPKYTAKWMVNGAEQTASTVEAVEGTELTFPSNPAATGSCAGLVFQGWVTEAIEGSTTTKPTYVNTENTITMPENGVTYYAVFAEEVPGEDIVNTYSHTISSTTWSANGAQTLSVVSWTLANNGSSYNYDATKGQQVGSKNNPAKSMSLTTSGISGKITFVKIYTSGAASVNATVSVSVNGVAYKNNNSTSVDITDTNTGYEFTGSETGEIVISWAQTSSKALYFKQIEVKYATPADPTYSNFVTTCVACSKVELSAAAVENGSIKLQQDSKDVASVKTCDAAQEVNVVATPETGYELTGIELSGTAAAKASYENGVISIEKDAAGTLIATATFDLANYAVSYTAPTNGSYTIKVADAEAVSANTEAKMGQTITLAAEAAEGYRFTGWTVTKTASSAAVAVENNAFTMPAEAVTVAAKFAQVYSVADFIAIQNKGTAEYCIEGIVSYVKSLDPTKYTNAQYYISADGQRGSEVYIYNGKYLNGADFTSTSQLAEGDKVIVCGTWDGSNSRLNAANYLVSRVEGEHASYEIVGDLGKSNFMNGEKWLDSYLSGLSVNDVYNTGYKAEVESVELSANKEDEATLSTEDTKITVTAKKNNETLVEKEFDITVSAATLVSFVLKEGYKTEYYVGDELVKPTVIATLSDNSKIEETATACTGQNMSVAGNYTVNVAFTYGDITLDGENGAEYSITVKAVFNNEDAPHTVAKAIELIEASEYQAKQSSTDYMWVSGKVATAPNNSGTYTISDDGNSANALTVWAGKYFTSSTSAYGNVAVGDEVVLKGTIVNYQGSTAELTSSTVVYQLREPEFAIADIVAADEFESGFSEDLAVVPTANTGDAEFSLESSNTAVVTIVDGKLHAVAEGDAVITATRAATENENALNYKAKETTFNVHVIAAKTRYAVTFDADGGTGTDPVVADQVEGATVNLPENPYSKENSAFAAWVVNETESGNAVTVTDDHFTMPAAAVTVKATWNVVATCEISFYVGGTKVATANAPQTAEYTFTQVGDAVPGFTWVGWSKTEVSGEAEELPTIITSYTPEAGESSLTLYGIYSRVEGAGETNHYVLDYDAEDLANNSNWGAYTTTYDYTAADGSVWTIKAFKSSGMQINTTKSAYIKVPVCPAVIKQVELTCNASAKKAVKFCATASDAAAALANGSEATTQTLDLSSASVTTGYIIPTGNCQITRIDVAYDAEKTYYTSSPVEKVTVTFALAGGEGGCQTTKINKGSELTICDAVPTKSHSEFAGWKNGDDEYVAGTAYTFNANITLTAQWNDAATYAVTYNVNGSSDAAPTQEAQYAGDQFEVGAAVTKEGFTFQGWKYGSKLYKAGASFTMPAEAVEFVAQWRKASVPVDKMSMVTSASALSNGMQIALGCSFVKDEQSYFAMAGDLGSNKYMASVTDGVSLSNGVATYTEDVVVMTLEQVENGWKITKDGTNYLYAASNADMSWKPQADATVWTISFAGKNAIIASGDNKIQYNKQSPRFKTYTSQTDIQLFGKAVVVTEDASISDLGYTEGEDIIASGDMTLTIDEETNAKSITAQNGATVVVEETTTATSIKVDDKSKINITAQTTVNEVFSVAATMGGGKSGQVSGVDKVALAQSVEAYFDITLGANGTSAQWHAIAVPFPVDAINGIYDAATGEKLTNEVNYAIMAYDGAIRATGAYGWKKYRQILQPGVFYLMTVDGDTKTFRFKMSGITLPTATSLALSLYAASGDGQGTDAGWNGVANPTLKHGTVNQTVTVLNPETYTYEDHDAGSYNFVVGTPFFIQADATIVAEGMEMGAVDGEKPYYAPRRASNNIVENIKVFFGNEEYKDKLTISANEEALNEYQIGKDLVKMTMTNTPKVAQIFGNAYNAKLCRVYAPMSNDKAEYSLTLYAPEAGEYTISVPEMENAEIYLTKDGAIIWNLTMSEYTNDFAKGNNEGYGLLLIKKITGISTGVENIEAAEAGVQKVVIDDKVFILRGEKMYDVTGKMVK